MKSGSDTNSTVVGGSASPNGPIVDINRRQDDLLKKAGDITTRLDDRIFR
jgi:hypothetical protein